MTISGLAWSVVCASLYLIVSLTGAAVGIFTGIWHVTTTAQVLSLRIKHPPISHYQLLDCTCSFRQDLRFLHSPWFDLILRQGPGPKQRGSQGDPGATTNR